MTTPRTPAWRIAAAVVLMACAGAGVVALVGTGSPWGFLAAVLLAGAGAIGARLVCRLPS